MQMVAKSIAIAPVWGYVGGMSENTEVILGVTFINGILYALIQNWKLRRAAAKERSNSGAPAD